MNPTDNSTARALKWAEDELATNANGSTCHGVSNRISAAVQLAAVVQARIALEERERRIDREEAAS